MYSYYSSRSMGISRSKGIERYIEAQEKEFEIAHREISKGKKESHWIWYIYPQIKGLGMSYMDREYSIKSIEESVEYVKNNILKRRLLEMTQLLLNIEHNDIKEVMWYPDDLKLRSCMTLFYAITGQTIFEKVIDKFYKGEKDLKTIEILIKMFEEEKSKLEQKYCKEFEKRLNKMAKEEKEKFEKRLKLEKEKKLKEMKEKEEKLKKLKEKKEEENKKNKELIEKKEIIIDNQEKLKTGNEIKNRIDNKQLCNGERMDLDENNISNKNITKIDGDIINKEDIVRDKGEKANVDKEPKDRIIIQK